MGCKDNKQKRGHKKGARDKHTGGTHSHMDGQRYIQMWYNNITIIEDDLNTFKLLPSSVQFQLVSSVKQRLALILVITLTTHPPTPTRPRESIFEQLAAYLGS